MIVRLKGSNFLMQVTTVQPWMFICCVMSYNMSTIQLYFSLLTDGSFYAYLKSKWGCFSWLAFFLLMTKQGKMHTGIIPMKFLFSRFSYFSNTAYTIRQKAFHFRTGRCNAVLPRSIFPWKWLSPLNNKNIYEIARHVPSRSRLKRKPQYESFISERYGMETGTWIGDSGRDDTENG